MSKDPSAQQARRWRLAGRVQGVGFRPFVLRLARRLGVCGAVWNQQGQVAVEAQAAGGVLDVFGRALLTEAPPAARPHLLAVEAIAVAPRAGFAIAHSEAGDAADVHLPPDLMLCDACRAELFDPANRRHRYPFINCTQCGPRYTLITALPYDRPNTTLAGFALCAACRAEYENPDDRRFHAEPVACPECGPRLEWQSPQSDASGDAALAACVQALRAGGIVAVKGVGAYHLLCDARSADAIARLRARKPRPHKPLAVMFPWRGADGLELLRRELHCDAVAEAALNDPARPIVLLRKRADGCLPDSIAPNFGEVGAMLPYSPLHELLLEKFGGPVVATSANVGGEPALTEAAEVVARLSHLTQYVLHHDRPIARPAEDSVVRVIAGQARLLRAGRGHAPLEFELPHALPMPTLAVGAHLKNAIALGWDRRVVSSPHIGDLDTPRALACFEQTIADIQRLYGVRAQAIVCDQHPRYASSRWAHRQSLPLTRVWHHHAHASALALEHDADLNWLCFTWDGLGLGEDGSLFGGEAWLGRPGAWRRAASLRPFRLVGGERAGREPWRAAAGLCWEAGLAWPAHARIPGANLARHAWQTGLNILPTSAAGRLFDGAASLLGLLDTASFEGQGPAYLEACAAGEVNGVALPLAEDERGLAIADWAPLVRAMQHAERSVAERAMQFHATLAQTIVALAQRLQARHGFDAVGLTGGVFQNKLLSELALAQLARAGFRAHLPRQAPCNDGAIALGQIVEISYSCARMK